MTDRAFPPLRADALTTLSAWLDFYRATLLGKCEGLTDEQLRTASVPPSSLTLLGLVQHLAAVERNWFRRVLAGEDVPPLYPRESGTGHDGGFEPGDAGIAGARAVWEEEVAHARRVVAAAGPEGTGTLDGNAVSVTWVLTHVIAEYARHTGHADLVRERIDGATGV
ncbi:DinB family protein [Pseudonocardia tropica]|uniref:DinB family protein n=1 Tax=Pseudonocardia tropica TaxID=681289 RepID=A0ABV1JNP0_9PSEU